MKCMPGLRVEVVCAWPDRGERRELVLEEGATVRGALSAAGLRAEHGAAIYGRRVPLELLFTVHEKRPRSELAQALGVHCNAEGYIEADDEQKTTVPGVYAAGDVTRAHNHQISSAVHEGGMAAAAANYYLYGALQKEQAPTSTEAHE